MMEIHLAFEALHHHGLAGANHQHIRLFASHYQLHYTKAVTGFSMKSLNEASSSAPSAPSTTL